MCCVSTGGQEEDEHKHMLQAVGSEINQVALRGCCVYISIYICIERERERETERERERQREIERERDRWRSCAIPSNQNPWSKTLSPKP